MHRIHFNAAFVPIWVHEAMKGIRVDNPTSLSIILFTTLAMTVGASANEQSNSSTENEDLVAIGQKLYKKNCRACHGPTAKGVASYPKLRDQTVEYLVDKLTRYRAGEKFGPNTPLMAPRAKKLSDEDIVNISTFIASIE